MTLDQQAWERLEEMCNSLRQQSSDLDTQLNVKTEQLWLCIETLRKRVATLEQRQNPNTYHFW